MVLLFQFKKKHKNNNELFKYSFSETLVNPGVCYIYIIVLTAWIMATELKRVLDTFDTFC